MWDLQVNSLALYQLSYRDIVTKVFENDLLKDFKNHAADLGPVLVDTCFVKKESVRFYLTGPRSIALIERSFLKINSDVIFFGSEL